MYHEITPLYYSEGDFQLLAGQCFLLESKQRVLETLNQIRCPFLEAIGTRNAQYITKLTIAKVSYGPLGGKPPSRNGSDLDPWVTQPMIPRLAHLYLAETQIMFPRRPTIEYGSTYDHYLQLSPDQIARITHRKYNIDTLTLTDTLKDLYTMPEPEQVVSPIIELMQATWLRLIGKKPEKKRRFDGIEWTKMLFQKTQLLLEKADAEELQNFFKNSSEPSKKGTSS